MDLVRYPYRNPYLTRVLDVKELGKWFVRGCPAASPDIVKRRIVSNYATQFGLDTFVESGTYLGDMVQHMSRYCSRIYSVEYQASLWRSATKRFAGRAGIHILHGSGSAVIPSIVSEIHAPALFWLDGHFAVGTTSPDETACPTVEELRAVLRHPYEHVVLVDDAREFHGEGGYPKLDDLISEVRALRTDVAVTVQRDMIRITPYRPR
jgi:hypothetical protein